MDYLQLKSLFLISLATLSACDTSLIVGIDYYISSNVNSAFVSNLVGYTDGTDNWPGVAKDDVGTFSYARWQITSIEGQPGYTLSNDNGLVLDIRGGSSTSQNNPEPFLNSKNDPTLDGQSSWWFEGATESGLANADNGFWTAIVNTAWNKALSAPDMGSAEAEACVLVAPPSQFDNNNYWFFASVTRGTVTVTATVTSVTTSTGDAVTQTINEDGPTSTITSTILRTLTTTTELTTQAPDKRTLARRYDFTTITSTDTSTFWLTSTVAGPVVSVTSQGGYVYETVYVTSSFYITETSTVLTAAPATETVTQDPVTETKTQAALTSDASPNSPSSSLEGSSQTNSPGVTSPRPTSSGSSTQVEGSSSSPTGGAGISKSTGNKSSTPVAAIVGGTLGGVIIILVAAFAFWFCRRRNKERPSNKVSNVSNVGDVGDVRELPPNYSRRSELPPSDIEHVAAWETAPREKVELGSPETIRRKPVETPVARESTYVDTHELGDGDFGATMNNGPRYEMPEHSNW